jgi:transposase
MMGLGTIHRGWYERTRRRVRDLPCGPHRIYLDLEVRRVACRRCGKVKRERLQFLLENALHSERFARCVGRRRRTGTIKDIAKETNLDWQTAKLLEMRYVRAQLERSPNPSPQALGIDEISIRKSHVYRIVVSELHRQRPI